jgi:uncharacterized damage-inducible protein DinB
MRSVRNEDAFLRYSAEKLRQYTDRICVCLDKLTEEQVWARGSDNENAVGNLVLHLTGNVRQWIGFGVGGWENVRDRDSEFRARGGMPLEDLQTQLRVGVDEALSIITQLTPDRLAETTNVQGYDVTVLRAVYHVVEHFAQHTGQIIFITKMLTSEDLAFYGHLAGIKHTDQTP